MSQLHNPLLPGLITSVALPGATPEEMADPLLNDRTMLEECGLIYVAQNEKNGKVEVFSTATQKFSQISSPASLKYEELILAGGILIRQKVMRNGDDTGLSAVSGLSDGLPDFGHRTLARRQ